LLRLIDHAIYFVVQTSNVSIVVIRTDALSLNPTTDDSELPRPLVLRSLILLPAPSVRWLVAWERTR
jgi:hypothetical protein